MSYIETIKKLWPEATEREVDVRAELDALYKEQSVLGRGLDKYERIKELDAELVQLTSAKR